MRYKIPAGGQLIKHPISMTLTLSPNKQMDIQPVHGKNFEELRKEAEIRTAQLKKQAGIYFSADGTSFVMSDAPTTYENFSQLIYVARQEWQ